MPGVIVGEPKRVRRLEAVSKQQIYNGHQLRLRRYTAKPIGPYRHQVGLEHARQPSSKSLRRGRRDGRTAHVAEGSRAPTGHYQEPYCKAHGTSKPVLQLPPKTGPERPILYGLLEEPRGAYGCFTVR
jgi:hypothetical protein